MSAIYEQMIMEDLGCDVDTAREVEDIMRHDIFHSTLDWQTREQLREAAHKAKSLMEAQA